MIHLHCGNSVPFKMNSIHNSHNIKYVFILHVRSRPTLHHFKGSPVWTIQRPWQRVHVCVLKLTKEETVDELLRFVLAGHCSSRALGTFTTWCRRFFLQNLQMPHSEPVTQGLRARLETHNAVEVRVEAPDVVGGVTVGGGGGGGGAPQWFQTLLIPHVGPSRATAVGRGQVQGGAALQGMTSRSGIPSTHRREVKRLSVM